MSSESEVDTVPITALEPDERVDQLQRNFGLALTRERGYQELDAASRDAVDTVLRSIETMRFESRDAFERVLRSLLGSIAGPLNQYVTIALEAAERSLLKTQGVLVIYTGGTIGSAPKDPNDPESPQVVRPWKELKNAAPQLGLLGYPVDAVSFVEPLDSCNVGPAHWRTMVRIIVENYDRYVGFVILHGTDTMVYTASALSFMLVDLAKPVVLTGSQVAGIVNPRNDAHQNIVTALMVAAAAHHDLPVIPEVCIVFGNIISRGNRAKKMDVVGFQGFRSPNYPSLGEAGEFVVIDRKQTQPIPQGDLQKRDQLDTNVIMLEVFPGMQHSRVVQNILRDDALRGVVLKSYGAGNIPTNSEFLALFYEFIQHGGIVVNVTSVPEGEVVMGLYETSQVLVDRGMLGGFDLTPEAAMCKLMMLLGEYGTDMQTVKRLMQKAIAGEQSLGLETTSYSGAKTVKPGTEPVSVGREELQSADALEEIHKVMLRFISARIDPSDSERVQISVRLDDGTPLGVFRRGRVPERALVRDESVGESVVFDLTPFKQYFVRRVASGRDAALRSSQKTGFVLELDGPPGAEFSWESAELNIFVRS